MTYRADLTRLTKKELQQLCKAKKTPCSRMGKKEMADSLLDANKTRKKKKGGANEQRSKNKPPFPILKKNQDRYGKYVYHLVTLSNGEKMLVPVRPPPRVHFHLPDSNHTPTNAVQNKEHFDNRFRQETTIPWLGVKHNQLPPLVHNQHTTNGLHGRQPLSNGLHGRQPLSNSLHDRQPFSTNKTVHKQHTTDGRNPLFIDSYKNTSLRVNKTANSKGKVPRSQVPARPPPPMGNPSSWSKSSSEYGSFANDQKNEKQIQAQVPAQPPPSMGHPSSWTRSSRTYGLWYSSPKS